MFGMRYFNSRCDERWAVGRGWHHRHGGYGWAGVTAWGRRHDPGRPDAGDGDLRLIALALIAEQPRHGYEIIKVLEEKTEGWYRRRPASSIRR